MGGGRSIAFGHSLLRRLSVTKQEADAGVQPRAKSNKRTSEVFGLSQELLQTPLFLAVDDIVVLDRKVKF